MKIQIINGPNLNLLGKRDIEIYGTTSMGEYLSKLDSKNVDITLFQSNIEGEIIDKLHSSNADGIVLNAGGYSHTSVSIRDAVSVIKQPVVEVHISNISGRESFRHASLISPVAEGCIIGFGINGYEMAIDYLIKKLS